MKYTQVDKFVKDNNLLQDVEEKSGIYAITIDNKIAYIGQSKNLYQRCCQHIYNTENAMLNKEKKYLLLLAAKLGGHNVDCLPLVYTEEEELNKWEVYLIKSLTPQLNIQHNHKIDDLLIEQVIDRLKYQITRENNITYAFDGETIMPIGVEFDVNNLETYEKIINKFMEEEE